MLAVPPVCAQTGPVPALPVGSTPGVAVPYSTPGTAPAGPTGADTTLTPAVLTAVQTTPLYNGTNEFDGTNEVIKYV